MREGSRALDTSERLHLLAQMGQALAYVHSMGQRHNAISLAAYRLTKRNRVLLCDFGVGCYDGLRPAMLRKERHWRVSLVLLPAAA